MKRTIVAIVVCALLAHPALAVGRRKVTYVGGTVESLNQYKKAFEGELDLGDEAKLVLKVKDQTIAIPYDAVSSLEYQNSTQYRVGKVSGVGAAGVLALFVPLAAFYLIPALFIAGKQLGNKKRKRHYLTVIYTDANEKSQAMVLELGKNIQQETRAILTARSGKEIKVIMEEPDGD
jgi:hypothetical protein